MRFLSDRVSKEWVEGKLDPKLRGLVEEAADFAQSLYQWDLFLTCLLRTSRENDELYVEMGYAPGTHTDGVHVRGRGADIRVRDVDPDSVAGLTGYLNEKYVYDPDRPALKVALLEDGIHAGTAAHLHLQTHANTQNRHFEESPA